MAFRNESSRSNTTHTNYPASVCLHANPPQWAADQSSGRTGSGPTAKPRAGKLERFRSLSLPATVASAASSTPCMAHLASRLSRHANATILLAHKRFVGAFQSSFDEVRLTPVQRISVVQADLIEPFRFKIIQRFD